MCRYCFPFDLLCVDLWIGIIHKLCNVLLFIVGDPPCICHCNPFCKLFTNHLYLTCHFVIYEWFHSGKTYFTYSLIRHLKTLTNITDLKQKLHLHFCYSIENSVSSMKEAAKSSGVVTSFSSQYKLPSLQGKIIK